ncbi:hypothetical protein GCM10022419_111620 [Nonomuraea rosea]|uniref:Integrase catalytic domain-containing protein n=1 Tax=Nonomuraea rosea TaxID=638574 RepID=A0ABP6ZGA7_9ACTN
MEAARCAATGEPFRPGYVHELQWNERHLRRALSEYERFHNLHRAHQALTQAAPAAPPRTTSGRQPDKQLPPGPSGEHNGQTLAHHQQLQGLVGHDPIVDTRAVAAQRVVWVVDRPLRQ